MVRGWALAFFNPGGSAMLDFGFALFLALISAGLGCRLLRWVGDPPEHPLDRFGLAAPLGMGALALAALALGQFGGLNVPGLLALLGVVAALGLADGLRLARDLVRRPPRTGIDGDPPALADRLMGLLLAVTLAATALSSLAPVTDGDALCYHLQVPKVFLAWGSVGFEPDLHETVYPLATEMLYLIALAFRGPVACRGVQWVLGLALAANAAALARPSLGRRAWWAGAVALLVPAVTNGMAAPLNDVALAAFGTAAIVAWTRYVDRPGRATALLSGIFAGLAIGVKYPALVLAGMLFWGVALRPLHKRTEPGATSWRDAARFAAWFGLAALLAGGAWYLRAWLYTGNPVFPFFRAWFGAGLDEVLDPVKRPLPVTVWNILTALGPLTLEPHRFDSFAHQFGPVFLLFLPALLLEKAPKRVLGVVLLGYVFLMLCMTQRQSMRFLLIAVGPLSVGVAYLAVVWGGRRSIPARLLIASLVAVLGLEAGVALTRAERVAGTVLGPETEAAHLDRREPSFRVGRWVGANLPASARLIGQDHRGFYIPRPYTMELAHRRRTGLGTNGESADEVVEILRRRGFTHLLLCPPKGESDVEFDPTLGELLAPWLAARSPLYQAELNDLDELIRSYSIYDLNSPAVRVARAPEGPAR